MSQTPILRRKDGTTIAYHMVAGKSPCVVFLGGFMSDMSGTKASALDQFCRARGQAYLRFDYSGHGGSSGAFIDGTIGGWADDACFAINQLIDGECVLVGSSMGGWIMLLVAIRMSERVKGLVGIAAAADFTEDLIADQFTSEQKEMLEKNGIIYEPNDYDDQPTPITRALIEDGRKHLLLRQRIPLDCPVRLIHGMKDPDVPWQTSLRISQMLASGDVEIQLVKDGGHRMSEPPDLDRIIQTLATLLEMIGSR